MAATARGNKNIKYTPNQNWGGADEVRKSADEAHLSIVFVFVMHAPTFAADTFSFDDFAHLVVSSLTNVLSICGFLLWPHILQGRNMDVGSCEARNV